MEVPLDRSTCLRSYFFLIFVNCQAKLSLENNLDLMLNLLVQHSNDLAQEELMED